LRLSLADHHKETRAATYRLLRIIVQNSLPLPRIEDVLICRDLLRDSRFDNCREQALRYIRRIIEHPEGCHAIPMSIVRILVSISDQAEDKFRFTAVITLCELALFNIQIVAHSGGLKPIFKNVTEFPLPILKSVASLFNFLSEKSITRSFLRPNVELEMVIAQFFDAYGDSGDAQSAQKLQNITETIRHVLGSWTGLLYFCGSEKLSLKSIVDCLFLKNHDIQDSIVELIGQIIQVPAVINAGFADSPFALHPAVILMLLIDCGLINVF
jgi:rapamycin-insensitive companion of mTOR